MHRLATETTIGLSGVIPNVEPHRSQLFAVTFVLTFVFTIGGCAPG